MEMVVYHARSVTLKRPVTSFSPQALNAGQRRLHPPEILPNGAHFHVRGASGAGGSSCPTSFGRGDRLHEGKLIESRCRGRGRRICRFITLIDALSKV